MKLLLVVIVGLFSVQSFAGRQTSLDIRNATYWLTDEGDLSGIAIKALHPKTGKPFACNAGMVAMYEGVAGNVDCSKLYYKCSLNSFKIAEKLSNGNNLVRASVYADDRRIAEIPVGILQGKQVKFSNNIMVRPILVTETYSFLERYAGKRDTEFCAIVAK